MWETIFDASSNPSLDDKFVIFFKPFTTAGLKVNLLPTQIKVFNPTANKARLVVKKINIFF